MSVIWEWISSIELSDVETVIWRTCWWIPNGYNLLIRNIIMQSFATKICLDFIMQCRAIFPTGGRSTSIEIGMNRAKILWLINIQPTLCLVSMFNIAAFVQSNRGKSISYACLTPIVLVLIKLFVCCCCYGAHWIFWDYMDVVDSNAYNRFITRLQLVSTDWFHLDISMVTWVQSVGTRLHFQCWGKSILYNFYFGPGFILCLSCQSLLGDMFGEGGNSPIIFFLTAE